MRLCSTPFSWYSPAIFTFFRKFWTGRNPSNKLSACKFQDELGLNDLQIEVLGLLMKGKSNKVIARTLNMAVPTVKNHITIVLKALKVTSRTEAVIKVGQMDWDLAPKPES